MARLAARINARRWALGAAPLYALIFVAVSLATFPTLGLMSAGSGKLPDKSGAAPDNSRATKPTPPRVGRASAPSAAILQATPDKQPLFFVENRGQVDGRVSYYAQGIDRSVYFTNDGVTFAVVGPRPGGPAVLPADAHLPPGSQTGKRLQEIRQRLAASQGWALKLDFVGADPRAQAVARGETPTTISYFKGSPDKWKSGLKTFDTLTYANLWPGIDLVYTAQAGQLKYQFVVNPGADPNQIRLSYRGASDVRLNASGRLEVKTPVGGFVDEKPVSYQESGGQRSTVESAFELQTPGQGAQTYGFRVGAYDRGRQLVIDPAILLYAGYVGGTSDDYGEAIAVGSDGSAYITSYTLSNDFPTTVGAFDTGFDPNCGYAFCSPFDAYVAKINPAGTGITYATYIGGDGDDLGYGIAVDSSGNAYVAGLTTSNTGFPVTTVTSVGVVKGYQTAFGGSYDGFLVKLDSTGSTLAYGTFLGGSGYDEAHAVAVDNTGHAYVVGYTVSTNYPVTTVGGGGVSAYKTTITGAEDVFLTKLNTLDGTSAALNYSTYFGGTQRDFGYGVALSGTSAYITGSTNSSNFPTSAGAFDTSYNGALGACTDENGTVQDCYDVFVAEINTATAGTVGLTYSTYLGGSGQDEGKAIALDSVGNAYVTGYTNSVPPSFPATGGPDLFENGNFDAFVAKLNPAGSALSYCGYIGGSGEDRGTGVAVDSIGNAYVSGFTNSPTGSFPATQGPGTTYNAGVTATCGSPAHNCYDGFVAKVNTNATLGYAGYIGGSGDDQGADVAVDSSGNAYVVGYTESTQTTFPVTVGPDLTYNGGFFDAFVAKVQAPQPSLSINDVTVNEGNSGTTSATFTVTLSQASPQTVTVNYATANGTATAGSDYNSTSGTLTFSPGVTAQNVNVLVNGDTLNEANETFFVNLSGASGATISDSQGQGTITNDDPVPGLSINDVSVAEGNSGTTNAMFTVSLSAVSGQSVSVNYATADGTATAGSDYTAASGTLTIPAGSASGTITVAVAGDTAVEPNETFFVNLSSATNATISDSQGQGTIGNDDTSLSINDVTVTEGNSGTTIAQFTVSLSAASVNTVTVNYATANGTASAPSDYSSASGALTFSPGVTAQNVNVLVNGDTYYEINETFFVNLSGPTNATVSDSQGQGTITNDDSVGAHGGKIVFHSDRDGNNEIYVMNADGTGQTRLTNNVASDVYPAFNPAGTKIAFTSDRDNDNEIYVMNADGTGQTRLTNAAGADFNPTFSPDGARITFESNRDGGNAEIYVMNADGTGQTRLTNNARIDTEPVFSPDATKIAFEEFDGSQYDIYSMNADGTGLTNLTNTPGWSELSPGFSPDGTKIVYHSYQNGNTQIYSMNANGSGQTRLTANNASDVYPAFSPDGTKIAFTSDRDGNNEIYSMNADGTLQTRLTTNTATDNNPSWVGGEVYSLSINDVTQSEGNSGTTTFAFTVTLSPAPAQTVTVAYATANGTAAAGSDYTSASGTLTFAPGETTKPVNVSVNGDTSFESDETFFVNLSAATNALISRAQGVGTITNDDSPSADLVMAKSVSPTTASPGATLTYTLTVTNNGPDTASSLTISDTLPPQTTFVSCSTSPTGSCGGQGNARNATFPILVPNASVIVTLTATLNCGTPDGTVGNTASVSSATGDPSTNNNSATANVTVSDTTSISPASQTFTTSGGTGSINVTTGCSWTAASNNTWITINSGASGTGNGTVGFTVGANNTGAPRFGSITVAGKTFKVLQATTQGGIYVDCTYTGTELGTIDQPFRTVNAAINAATTGQTLWVRTCHYNETVNTGKALNMLSFDGPVVIGLP